MVMQDVDYQKVVDDLDRQDFHAMEDKMEEIITIGESMKAIDKLERSMNSLRNTVIFCISVVVTIEILTSFLW
jgi:uncharacterized protein YpuA (DUF1002 family)|tara:strand:- start:390 stop:608 length:219 start_codon:yes stop_codon:yes gene_type:complete